MADTIRGLVAMGFRTAKPAEKFMLWVDAVGGFWVCVAEQVVLGQPSDGGPDVPILADLSTRHARIRRDGEHYLIEALGGRAGDGLPFRPAGAPTGRETRPAREVSGLESRPATGTPRDVRLNGRLISQSWLADGSHIELGETVKLTFRQPHPLSATARLEFASRHRTQPSSDGVLLLADSCVLGPKSHSHVVCRNWPQEVILFRHEEKLFCRAPGRFEIDGAVHRDRGQLRRDSRVTGEGFAFSLEPMEE
jgi:hypothetical protein